MTFTIKRASKSKNLEALFFNLKVLSKRKGYSLGVAGAVVYIIGEKQLLS